MPLVMSLRRDGGGEDERGRTFKAFERVLIGDNIWVTIRMYADKGQRPYIVVDAPSDIRVLRESILKKEGTDESAGQGVSERPRNAGAKPRVSGG